MAEYLGLNDPKSYFFPVVQWLYLYRDCIRSENDWGHDFPADDRNGPKNA